MTELSGRTVKYAYDNIYRLTSETIASDPNGINGTIGYPKYDNVGNRLQQTSSVSGIPAGLFNYDANDRRVSADTYDANGNTLTTTGNPNTNVYDFENHLVQQGAVTIVYDGDGNRVSKSVNGVVTKYLVDHGINPTTYSQVILEDSTANGETQYVYGLERISERYQGSASSSTFTVAYYGYDGHGSVRFLTSPTGSITATYDYDAFGNLLHITGTTPNVYRFAGEQWDPDLNLYYNRARYLNTGTGRFLSMDTFEGDLQSPSSLHKYLYVADNPTNMVDPLGKWATFIHGRAIDHAPETSLLPADDRQILRGAQDEADTHQAAVQSYRHAMRDGTHGQSVAQARALANNYVRDRITDARTDEASHNHTQAMVELGQAMHTLQDSTSPAHHGFQPWYDYRGGEANPCEWIHGLREVINPGPGSWLYRATDKAYQYFREKDKPLPTDFFADLGVDSVGGGLFFFFHPIINILPAYDMSVSVDAAAGTAF